jgi:hypothetical protein
MMNSRTIFSHTITTIWTKRSMVTLLSVVLLSSCKGKPKETEREVLTKPQIILDADIPITELTLAGIKIGDPESAIDKSLIRKTADHPDRRVVWCTNGTGYNIVNGKVVWLQLNGDDLLSRLGIANPDAMKKAMGPPDEMKNAYMYVYTKRHQVWDWKADGIDLINIEQ